MQGRRRPLFFIDIAVPRNVETSVNTLDNVYVYDIDDLKSVVDANLRERSREAQRAEGLVEREVAKFVARLRDVEVIPTIVSLRERLETIRQAEIRQGPDPSARGLARGARGPRRAVQRHREQDPAHPHHEAARVVAGRRGALLDGAGPRAVRPGADARDPCGHAAERPGPGPGERGRATGLRARGDAVEIVPMRTEGDRLAGAPLALVGGKGLFVREIEEALLASRSTSPCTA